MSEDVRGLCLVTGATGFIGQAFCRQASARKRKVRAATRQATTGAQDWVQVEVRGATTDWRKALQGCQSVLHAAGRAHVLDERDENPLALFRQANVEATIALAEQAREQGIKRFVFLSSIGVNGNVTSIDSPFSERDQPNPQADYARSKLEAEQVLARIFQDSATELVIVRPPLVYAGHAPGNFARLLRGVQRRLPLPFASVKNARSMVALENLVDFLDLCLEHPAAAGQTFVVADGRDFSIGEIIELLAEGMGYSPLSLPVPPSWLAAGARLVGFGAMHQQLCESLRVDAGKAMSLLNWTPPVEPAQALRDSARQWLARRG